MDTLQFLVQCGRLMLLSLSLSVEGIYLLLNADKKAKHPSCLHELYLAELCSAAGLALDISNVGLVDTIKDSINHLKEIQVFCLTRVAIFLSIPATYSHDRYSILRLRSAIFLHNKFTCADQVMWARVGHILSTEAMESSQVLVPIPLKAYTTACF